MNDSTDSLGYLELFLGPMFSGKTTRLIQLYKQFTYIDKKVAVINYVGDKRYSETMLSTHDNTMIPCISLQNLSDAWDDESHTDHRELMEADVILINEGQFFADLYEVVLEMVEGYEKRVYIAGLDADFQRQPFGRILELIPYCDAITKLTALCSICKNGRLAIHSLRTVANKQQILIGSDIYKPVCRDCFHNSLIITDTASAKKYVYEDDNECQAI